MKQIIIVTILLTVLWGCNNSKNKKSSTKSEKITEKTSSDFASYISTLDPIKLPLKTNPLEQLPEISKNFDKKNFEKYKHKWTSQPLGIYYQNEKTIGIIDCSIGDWGLVPFLTTYDFMGNKIDSTGFYNKSGQDMGHQAIEHLTFNTDRTITVLDTVKLWKLNKDETDIIEESMKMTTGKVVYQILRNGKIEKK